MSGGAYERLHCGSVSCRRAIVVQWGAETIHELYEAGWAFEQQPVDDQEYWYCDRCKL